MTVRRASTRADDRRDHFTSTPSSRRRRRRVDGVPLQDAEPHPERVVLLGARQRLRDDLVVLALGHLLACVVLPKVEQNRRAGDGASQRDRRFNTSR